MDNDRNHLRMKFKGSINLTYLNNVQIENVNIGGEIKECVCIPIGDNELYRNKNGIFLGFIALPKTIPYYNQTHSLQLQWSKKRYSEKGEDEYPPFLGAMQPFFAVDLNNKTKKVGKLNNIDF